MPHDKNEKPLKQGDEVTIRAKVTSLKEGEEWANLAVDTVEPVYPSNSKTHIVLNSRQVEKCLTTAKH